MLPYTGLRPLPEPVRSEVAEGLSALALLVSAGELVAWSEDHEDEARTSLRVEVDAAGFCALCVEREWR